MIYITSYNTAFFEPGGGEKQLTETYSALKEICINVSLLDTNNASSVKKNDIIHVFSVYRSVENFASLALDKRFKLVVSPIHWPVDVEIDSDERDRIGFILRAADALLVNSNAEAEKLTDFYSLKGKRFYKIVNAVEDRVLDLKYYHMRHALTQANISNKRKRVITLCNIDKRKNLISLAEACRNLGYQLVIAGGCRNESILEDIYSILPDLEYLGRYSLVDQDFLAKLLECDIFALVSHYETPGIAALEAAIMGMPVVITDQGCTKEYFHDNAFYCNPYDIASIQEALQLASSSFRPNKRFIEHIASRYTWRQAALQTMVCYKSLSEI